MQSGWDVERINLFKAEIVKMFLAYNKPVQKPIIDAKAELMAEVLTNLKTSKIQDFFIHVRSTEDTLPNDGVLKKILSSNFEKFTNYIPPEIQIEYNSSELPSDNWLDKFWKNARKVLNGSMTSEEAKAESHNIL